MTSATATISLNPDWFVNGQVTSLEELVSAIEGASVGDFNRNHIEQSTSSIITLSATQPTTPYSGMHWLDTSSAPFVLKFYDGSAFVAVTFARSATAPGSPSNGDIWYDQTLDLLRVYETKDSISGFFPVSDGYDLWVNKHGSAVNAGECVVRAATFVRGFALSSIEKSGLVVGVCLETVNNDVNAVLVLVSSGAIVSLEVAGATHGAVVEGDYLATYSAGGMARNVGPANSGGYIDVDTRIFGTPFGSFAVALQATSSDTTIRARLLGYVGGGATVLKGRLQLTAGSTNDTYFDIDFTTLLEDASHAPLLAGYLNLEYACTGGAGPDNVEASITITNDTGGATPIMNSSVHGRTSGGDGFLRLPIPIGLVPLVNSTSVPTALGQLVAAKFSRTVGTASSLTPEVYGYIY